jgi:hypothetical protein
MLLAEQGHAVTKWWGGDDPILHLRRGAELWAWINQGKTLVERHPREVGASAWDLILDNFRPSTLASWQVDPVLRTTGHPCVWVSMRAEVGEVSFDLLAQCRSTMEYAPWIPFYLGDTAGGLWCAFKGLSAVNRRQYGHHVLYHATCLQKLVEGELVVVPDRDGKTIPWDCDAYGFVEGQAVIDYKGVPYREPIRDHAWKWENLRHEQGRMVI